MMDLKSIKRVSAILFFSLITNFAAYAADPAPASAATDKNSARSNESPANQRMKMNDPKLQADLKEASSKTMVKPDFAFPRQVSDKAQALYDQALRERKPITAIRAAMQLNVASALISADSAASALDRYRELQRRFDAPYSTMAQLLEARLLYDIYMSDMWQYDQRELPDAEAGDEPLLWSGSQFKSRIRDLAGSVMRQRDILAATPIEAIAPLITNSASASQLGMTAFDFACYQIIDILPETQMPTEESIPFRRITDASEAPSGTSGSTKRVPLTRLGIITTLIETDAKDGDAAAGALIYARIRRLQMLQADEAHRYAEELMRLYPESHPLRPQLIAAIIDGDYLQNSTPEVNRSIYMLIEKTMADFPDSPYYGNLSNRLQEMRRPYVSVNCSDQILSGTESSVSYTNRNLKDSYLLLVSLPYHKGSREGMQQKNVSHKSTVKVLAHLRHDLPYPFESKDTVVIPALRPGFYAIIPSARQDLSGVYHELDNTNVPVINVCDFTLFTTAEDLPSANDSGKITPTEGIYVADAHTGAPIKGATVAVSEIKDSYPPSYGPTETLHTDESGFVKLPSYRSMRCDVSHNGSFMRKEIWNYSSYYSSDRSTRYAADLLTDLPIYRPGDKIQCAIAVAANDSNLLSPAAGLDVIIRLIDANLQTVADVKARTDASGRAIADFNIPTDRITGTYSIAVKLPKDAKRNWRDNIGYTRFEVAEYKAPTFRVKLDQPQLSSERLEITGCVTTYSGMPLADTDVDLSIGYNPMWWRFYNSSNLPSSFGDKITTGSDGRFSLILGLEDILGTGYEYGSFTINASATSSSGETCRADSRRFCIGRGYSLSLSDSVVEVTGDSIAVPVTVYDSLGKTSDEKVDYKLISPDGAVVASGSAMSSALRFDSSLLPSGRYGVEVILPEARKDLDPAAAGRWIADTAKCSLVVWRAADRRPPYDTPLWIPNNTLYAPDSTTVGSNVGITAGSAYADSYLFYLVADCHSVVKRGWIKASEANTVLDVAAPMRGNEVKVTFFGIHDLDARTGTVTVFSADRRRKLRFITETFRDRINPGTPEKWSFRLADDASALPGASVMAVLSDAALNAIAPFSWSFNPERILNYSTCGRMRLFRWSDSSMSGFTIPFHSLRQAPAIQIPEWNLWGQSLYEMRYMTKEYMAVARGSMVDSFAMAMPEAAEEEVAMDSAADSNALMTKKSARITPTAGDSGEGAAPEASQEITFRDTECPLAFFRPLLSTDSLGNVTIDFEVPNFNTTWQLQLLGYDDTMKSTISVMEAVASKPVMISSNMPRFLLTGDKASVEAIMFNNTDSEIMADGLIEIFDPVSEKVIARGKSSAVRLQPKANAMVKVMFDVPSDLNAVGIRASVRSAEGSDGEQDLIQVLPASQPVAEATVFYLTPDQKELSVKLPDMGKDDLVTLNYCANPAWYVLTSLSGHLSPDTQSTLTNLNALYANCVASGLIGKYPSLAEALRLMFSGEQPDSITVSPLSRNQELKSVSVANTPWVNNAESETARMGSLRTLADKDKAAADILAQIDILRKNQKADGSMAWMPQMDGSLWITLNLIDCAARLQESGFMPESPDMHKMVDDAITYADRTIAEDYRKTVMELHQKYPLVSEMEYLLNRSILTRKPCPGYIETMRQDMLGRIPQEWKELSIADKASAARIMQRDGNHALAAEILQSVREFASYKPDKGMWFDNLRDSWWGPSPKTVTAECLTAFNEVLPGDDAIMKMSQYIVLSRQTEDWNVDMTPGAVTQVVNSILVSDLGWTDLATTPAMPEITLGGRRVELPASAETLTGNVYLSVTPEMASGRTLKVSRQAGVPAWGGVMRQYVAPAAKVKAQSVPQLKITKQLLPVKLTQSGSKASKDTRRFHKGELIRVTLTLVSDRDLDYLFISDRRGAFMQPADQLTSYEINDGVWLLRETRNTATNFFITRLPKGKYVISYEVNADRDGEYSTGIATAQSQYYPLITAHSAGCMVNVE